MAPRARTAVPALGCSAVYCIGCGPTARCPKRERLHGTAARRDPLMPSPPSPCDRKGGIGRGRARSHRRVAPSRPIRRASMRCVSATSPNRRLYSSGNGVAMRRAFAQDIWRCISSNRDAPRRGVTAHIQRGVGVHQPYVVHRLHISVSSDGRSRVPIPHASCDTTAYSNSGICRVPAQAPYRTPGRSADSHGSVATNGSSKPRTFAAVFSSPDGRIRRMNIPYTTLYGQS